MRLTISFIFLFTVFSASWSQSSNDLLNLLILNKSITQEQADSLRADAAIKQQDIDINKKSFSVSAARQIQISGYTQVRYQALSEAGKKDGFDIRRARLDLTGNFTPFLSYRLMPDFADKPKIMDAYAEIKINDLINFTIGQFRVPFSAENLTSVRKLDVIDFSQAVNALVFRSTDVIGNQNGRDIGIQLGGVLIKNRANTLLEYRLGVFNGSGINVADTANKTKDISSRLILTPLNGLSIGVSYYNGMAKAIKPTTGYTGRNQAHNRFGLDMSYTLKRLALRGEYIHGADGNIDKAGWFVLAEYFVIPQKLQLVGKYDTYDKDLSMKNDASINYVTGVNYNFNTWSRIQVFYTIAKEQGMEIKNNFLSVQYQIGF